METQFDQEIEQDMAEIDQELSHTDAPQEDTQPNPESAQVEENALEATPSDLIEESGGDVVTEDLETTPEEVSQAEGEGEGEGEESETSQDMGEVESEKEIDEFLNDQSDNSEEKSEEIVSSSSSVEEDDSQRGEDQEETGSQEGSQVSGEAGSPASSEKAEASEASEFKADDEILEEDEENSLEHQEEMLDEMMAEDSQQTETIEESSNESETTEPVDGFEASQPSMNSQEASDDSISEISPKSVEAEKLEDLSETSEFHDELHTALEQAIKDNPNAKQIMLLKFDKDDEHPKVEHIDVEDYEEEYYNRQGHANHKSVEEILTESMSGGNGSEIKPALNGPILGDKSVAEGLRQEAEAIVVPTHDSNAPPSGVLDGSLIKKNDYLDFEHEPIQEAINHHGNHHKRPKVFGKSVKETPPMSKSEELKLQGEQAKDVYLTSNEKMHNALKLFAQHDALKRAMRKIPRGIPANVFLSDLMGISGVGDHKPTYNMIKYYGGLSEFHHHFAEQAKRQISFEDIDTLIGLLSDMNGIFTTIYDLLPTKDEVEGEKDNTLGKSVLDHAYDILRFYSQVRGFINTVVFNRHLIIQDIRFIKSRVNDLHTDIDDMLYFYSFDVQYLKVKTLGRPFSFDPKIEGFLKRIENISVGFGIDVKTILRSFFHFEKAVVFFDNDTRQLASGINVSTPLDAIRTIDSVIMYLIRVIELKTDIFKSLVNLKNSLENLAKYRSEILDNLRGAEQLIHYHTLQQESAFAPQIWALAVGLLVLFWKD